MHDAHALVLNDPGKADIGKIESMKAAKGTFTQSGQFQVIIGNTGPEFYNDFTEVSGISGVSPRMRSSRRPRKSESAAETGNRSRGDPYALLPAIITGGLIPGLPQLY